MLFRSCTIPVLALAAGASALTVSPGTVPSHAYKRLNPASAEEKLTYTVTLTPNNQLALDLRMHQIALTDDEWLTDAEIARYVRPKPATAEAVKTHLLNHGVKEADIVPNAFGDRWSVTSTVGQANKAWNTRLTYYHHLRTGAHALRTDKYEIPADLEASVVNVSPFTAFHNAYVSPHRLRKLPPKNNSAPQLVVQQQDGLRAPLQAAESSCDDSVIDIACIRSYYGSESYTPKPQDGVLDTLVMGYVGQYVSTSDLSQFLQQYRSDQSSYSISITTAGGGTNDESNPGTEAMLDVEMVAGVSAPLNTTFLSWGPTNPSSTSFFADSLAYVLEAYSAEQAPGVITISYGEEENAFSFADATALCNEIQKQTARGTTVVTASGDNGLDGNQAEENLQCNHGFNPTFPGGCPYTWSVGATQDTDPEVAVDGSVQGGFYSGAGFSNYFSRPSYQSDAVGTYLSSIGNANAGLYNKTGRAFPDTTAFGLNVAIVYQGQEQAIGGTSAAAPQTAAHIALLNNYRQQQGQPRIGWANPKLYNATAAFKDITQGKTGGCPGAQANNVFAAAKGWDPASGLGSPLFADWLKLLA